MEKLKNMKYRIFKQNKLWRDKLISWMEGHGSIIHTIDLNDEEYDRELKKKLVEEAQEVLLATSRKFLIEELADVFEVIDALQLLHSISLEDIVAVQKTKREQKGGFLSRKFIVKAEHRVGSIGEQYCLADPHKYPEITK